MYDTQSGTIIAEHVTHVRTLTAWGAYWDDVAQSWPEDANACAWNAYMCAMQIMAIEATRR